MAKDYSLTIEKLKKWENRLVKMAFLAFFGIGLSIASGLILSSLKPEPAFVEEFIGQFISFLVLFILLITLLAVLIEVIIFILSIVARKWMIAKKSLPTLLLAIFVFLVVILIYRGLTTPSGRDKAYDAKRMSDMRQMAEAQQLYYGENKKYLVSKTMPLAIGNFLDPVPINSANNEDYSYRTFDNTNDPQKFCYFARLKGEYSLEGGKKYQYFTASHAGNFKRATPPKTLDECAQGE